MHPEKATLRTELKTARRNLELDRAQAAARIAQHFLEDFPPVARTSQIAGFWSLPDEPDLMPLLTALSARGMTTLLPLTQGKDKPLKFRVWQPGDATQTGAYGIEEPTATAPTGKPDLILVPCLSVDAEGYRLGYGAGYYDRTLAALQGNSKPVTVAVTYQELVRKRLPREPHDIPVDYILTQHALRKVTSSR